MSALEQGLVAQLQDEPTPAERALQRIVTLFSENDRMSCHELRVLEIVLEGLRMPPGQRRLQIEAAIQRKRDRMEVKRKAQESEHAAS